MFICVSFRKSKGGFLQQHCEFLPLQGADGAPSWETTAYVNNCVATSQIHCSFQIIT